MISMVAIAGAVFALAVATWIRSREPHRAVGRRVPLWFTLLACAVVLAARRPDMLRNPQFWAEDGFFFERAYTVGWPALFQPYAGYFHTLPRLVGLLAVHCDPALAPGLFVGVAAALTLYVAGRTQSRRSPLSGWVWSAVAVVLIPDAFEVLLTIVNLQWVLAGGLILLLIAADAEGRGQKIHDAIAAALLALTGPFSVVLAPLFLVRAWCRRTKPSLVLALIVSVCAAIQVVAIATHPLPGETGTIQPRFLIAATGTRILGSLLFGHWLPAELTTATATGLGVITLVVLVILAIRPGSERGQRVWIALACLGLVASSLYRCRFVLPDLLHAPFGARYFYPLQLAIAWLAVHALRAPNRVIARAAAALLVVALVTNSPRLREAALTDQHWPDFVPRIRTGEAVVVPINPPGWTMALPPRRVDDVHRYR